MQLRLGVFILIAVLLLALSACACEHQWSEVSCETPQVCTKCQTVGAPAAGHGWLDATCTEAATCSRCGAVQGEPLGHSFGVWEFGTDHMSRTCSVCAYTEETEIDRELYLETLLPGYWDFFAMYDDDGFYEASSLKLSGIEFHFGTDRTVTFYLAEKGTQQMTWSFDSYARESDADSYYFTLTCG